MLDKGVLTLSTLLSWFSRNKNLQGLAKIITYFVKIKNSWNYSADFKIKFLEKNWL